MARHHADRWCRGDGRRHALSASSSVVSKVKRRRETELNDKEFAVLVMVLLFIAMIASMYGVSQV